MSPNELYERIKLTIESPPCVIDVALRNCYCIWDAETQVMVATPGVAVAMVGITMKEQFIDRHARASACEMQWYYLMHFEQAIDFLFCGRPFSYNEIADFIQLPRVRIRQISTFDADNPEVFLNQLKNILWI